MNDSVARQTVPMPDLGQRIRRVVESFVPWYDRAAADRSRVDTRNEIAKSKATREYAQEELRKSFGLAGQRLGKR